jgi:hypothetical protein
MPTWTYQPNETDGIDTYLDNTIPTTNLSTSVGLFGGRYSPSDQYCTFLLKPDFAKGTNPPPSRAVFSSVVLTLYHVHNYATVSSTLYVYRCLRNWVESQATWNVYSTGNSWGTGGARNSTTDYYATALGSVAQSASEANGYKDITINVEEFQKMFNGIYDNYGFVLLLTSADDTLHEYASSSHATAAYRPKLTAAYASLSNTRIIIF